MPTKYKYFYILLFVISLSLASFLITYHLLKGRNQEMVIDGGTVKDHRLKGYDENIKSKNIISFEYNGSDYIFSCELKNNKLNVKSKSGYNKNEDYFEISYVSKDTSLLNKLQRIIEKYNISRNNGYEHEVAGLPPGLGDDIAVVYKSGEKIWKTDNQEYTISNEAIDAIYEVFYECAIENGYSFESTKKEETQIY